MAKIILSFAIAFLAVMTVFASAAEAGCISCDYVPSVANSPAKSYKAKRYRKKRVYRSTKKRKAGPAKKVEMAKTAPIKSETDNQNSTISTASLDNDDTVETDVEAKDQPRTTKTEEGNENSTISAATLQSDQTVEQNTLESEVEADDEPATTTNRDFGCKKFFPSVGMTLTAACE